MAGHEAPVAYHRALVDDANRIEAWSRAIREVVRPGDVVLDAGSGSGLLAVLAARAGARVHAVEASSSVELTRAVVTASGLASSITVHHADLTSIALPEPVDVVLCDLVGRFVPDRAMRAAVRATARLAHSETRFLPSEVRLKVAPFGDVSLPEIDAFRTPIAGVDLSAALPVALSTAYQTQLPPDALLAPAQSVGALTPPEIPAHVKFEASFTASRDGEFRGFAGWFEASLGSTCLDTRPGLPTFWGQVLWPAPPTRIVEGQTLRIRGEARPDANGVHFAWEASTTGMTHKADTSRLPAFSPNAEAPPAGIESSIQRGRELLQVGELDAALSVVGAACRSARGDTEVAAAHGQLGITLLHAGRDQAALHALRHALVLDPTLEEAHRYLVPCLDRLGRRLELFEAIARYEQRYGPHPFVSRA